MNFLNKFLIIYINNLIVYSENEKNHEMYVKKMLQRLRETELQADVKKCEFHVTKTKFLEMIVESNEIRMNSAKIQVIIE